MQQSFLRFICASAVFLAMGCMTTLFAWKTPWAPKVKAPPVKMTTFSSETIAAFLSLLECETITYIDSAHHCEGGMLDLNGDEIDDYVFLLPWMGCGLNADGYSAHFILSGGKQGRIETVVEGYNIKLTDLVQVNGKIYLLHSTFFNDFEKSQHNHWVYQAFTFEKDGTITHANAAFGNLFPAATIFYENPKFKRVPLTPNDLNLIRKQTTYPSRKYIPAQRTIFK